MYPSASNILDYQYLKSNGTAYQFLHSHLESVTVPSEHKLYFLMEQFKSSIERTAAISFPYLSHLNVSDAISSPALLPLRFWLCILHLKIFLLTSSFQEKCIFSTKISLNVEFEACKFSSLTFKSYIIFTLLHYCD